MAHFNLNKILDLTKWQDLQDSLADITKLAIITIDYKGKPISAHSKCTTFCQTIRATEALSEICQKCDSRAGLEAVRYNRPYIYLCHYNLIDIAIPITSDDKYIGAIMAGQVKPSFLGSKVDLEQILYSPDSLKTLQKSRELKRLYQEIPTLDYDTILRTADMLSKLSTYIIEEATAKNLIESKYQLLTSQTLPPIREASPPTEYTVDQPFINIKNKKLLPALEYLHTNTHAMISLDKAAHICHLSPGYFSRSFSKEFGSNYTNYITRLKIDQAKKLLTKTDLSIGQICDQLGFNDSGYFTKVFKKQEYLTPSMYRKYAPEEIV